MSGYYNWSKEHSIAEIKRLKKRKKFGLVWEDKPEDVAELCKAKLPVLGMSIGDYFALSHFEYF